MRLQFLPRAENFHAIAPRKLPTACLKKWASRTDGCLHLQVTAGGQASSSPHASACGSFVQCSRAAMSCKMATRSGISNPPMAERGETRSELFLRLLHVMAKPLNPTQHRRRNRNGNRQPGGCKRWFSEAAPPWDAESWIGKGAGNHPEKEERGEAVIDSSPQIVLQWGSCRNPDSHQEYTLIREWPCRTNCPSAT